MSDLGHPTRALQAYRGEARRREVRAHRGLPRDGSVVVHELRYANGEWALEVEAAWRGVAAGSPPLSPGIRPGVAHDSVNVGRDLELARALAGELVDALMTGAQPDAQAVLRRLRAA